MSTYIGQMLGLVTGPVVARVLGAESRGEYAAVLAYSTTATTVLALGIVPSVAYMLLTRKIENSVLFGNALKLALALVLPAFILSFLVAFLVGGLSNDARWAIAIFIAAAPLGVLEACLTYLLVANGALGSFAAVRIVPMLFNVSGVLLMAHFGVLTLISYFGLTFFGSLLALIVSATLLRTWPRFDGKLRDQIRFAIRGYPGTLAGEGNSRLDQLLIAPILGARDLGLYSIAITLVAPPLGIVSALSSRSVRAASSEKGGLDPRAAEGAIRQGLAFSLLAVTALLAAIPVAVPLLFGSEYKGSTRLAIVLALSIPAVSFSGFAHPFIGLVGRPALNSIFQLLAFAVTAICLFIAIPLFGILGAALAAVTAAWTRALLEAAFLSRVGLSRMVPGYRDFRAAVVRLIPRRKARRI